MAHSTDKEILGKHLLLLLCFDWLCCWLWVFFFFFSSFFSVVEVVVIIIST